MPLNHLISDQRLAQFRASAFAWLGWLLNVALCIGVFSKSRRLRHMVQRAERWAACYCFVLAAQSMPPPGQRARHKRRAPPGFRLVRGNMRLLLKSARIRVRGSLAARIAGVSVALADPAPYVAHFAKRIAAGLITTHLTIALPPGQISFDVASPAPTIPDSS
jgi:hypothetical protein